MMYRLWVNPQRTILVRLWPSGTVEVATRDHPSHTWGPPHYLDEERVPPLGGEDEPPQDRLTIS